MTTPGLPDDGTGRHRGRDMTTPALPDDGTGQHGGADAGALGFA